MVREKASAVRQLYGQRLCGRAMCGQEWSGCEVCVRAMYGWELCGCATSSGQTSCEVKNIELRFISRTQTKLNHHFLLLTSSTFVSISTTIASNITASTTTSSSSRLLPPYLHPPPQHEQRNTVENGLEFLDSWCDPPMVEDEELERLIRRSSLRSSKS
ncbi:hypothetical protein F2Q70_00009094 [Brassica cretica]|uniref:Uncharacterized protein n=1 Tax=Brassica cretica TaxID=69181 RepID=A0A8S9M7E8_BRACR|nr:hypothetical protein F2Q70_00009094 [Brassica cretica]